MIIWRVEVWTNDVDEERHFATKHEAIAFYRDKIAEAVKQREENDEDEVWSPRSSIDHIELERVVITDYYSPKKLVCKLLNQEGYVASRETLQTWEELIIEGVPRIFEHTKKITIER